MALDLVTPFTKVQLEEEIKDTGRKQVGILGGNFNPVHNAHLVVADQVRQQLALMKFFLCLSLSHLMSIKRRLLINSIA